MKQGRRTQTPTKTSHGARGGGDESRGSLLGIEALPACTLCFQNKKTLSTPWFINGISSWLGLEVNWSGCKCHSVALGQQPWRAWTQHLCGSTEVGEKLSPGVLLNFKNKSVVRMRGLLRRNKKEQPIRINAGRQHIKCIENIKCY